jgi:tRNA A-37 threonylcarbamoyl transferase component Bud32
MPTAPRGPNKGPDMTKRAAPAAPGGSSPYSGRVVARCRVGERLGRGATSHVFRAHYEPLSKDIALKILGKDSAGAEELRQRFLSEARSVAKISHENIVKVLDVVEDQGLLCILMELVEGPTLQDRLDDDGVIRPRQAFRIAAQIARALEAAHAEKIVHRDVKPANVMLVGPVGDETVKVVDFGLAVQQEMNRVGTPLFMSPEAAQGKRIDEKSDIYALGICLYRMLTGVLPFTGATVKEILAAQVNAELVPPSKQREQLGRAYDDLLKKLLVKSKGYRPSAAEAAEMLEEVADDLEERELGVRRERRRRKRGATKKSKPPSPAFWAGLAVAGVVVVGVIWALSGGERKPAAETTDVKPKVEAPPVAVVDPAETAFKEVETWIKENPGDRRGEIEKWKEFIRANPKGKWAMQAADRQKRAEILFGGRPSTPQPTRSSEPAPRRDTETPEQKYAKIQERERAFDFEGAWQVFNANDGLEPPNGVETREWDRKEQRLKFLRDAFVRQLDAGLKASKRRPKAKDVFADAKDGEVLVGANHEGGVVANADGSNEHTAKWSGATIDAFFKKECLIADNALDSNDFDSAVVLAALAVEFSQPQKVVDRFLSAAQGMTANDDTKSDIVRKAFGGSE